MVFVTKVNSNSPSAERMRKYRAANPESVGAANRAFYKKHKPAVLAYTQKRYSLGRAFIDAAHAGGCVDCGHKNLSVLQSDHIGDNKIADVSAMCTWSLPKLFAELDKCETVCANCHKLRTDSRRER